MNSLPPEDWDPKEQLKALTLEIGVMDENDQTKATARMMVDAAPMAAARLVQIATHSKDERRAMEASKYIVDRVLGPTGSPKEEAGAKTPLEEFLGDVVREAEAIAVGAAGAASDTTGADNDEEPI